MITSETVLVLVLFSCAEFCDWHFVVLPLADVLFFCRFFIQSKLKGLNLELVLAARFWLASGLIFLFPLHLGVRSTSTCTKLERERSLGQVGAECSAFGVLQGGIGWQHAAPPNNGLPPQARREPDVSLDQ